MKKIGICCLGVCKAFVETAIFFPLLLVEPGRIQIIKQLRGKFKELIIGIFILGVVVSLFLGIGYISAPIAFQAIEYEIIGIVKLSNSIGMEKSDDIKKNLTVSPLNTKFPKLNPLKRGILGIAALLFGGIILLFILFFLVIIFAIKIAICWVCWIIPIVWTASWPYIGIILLIMFLIVMAIKIGSEVRGIKITF